MTGEHGGELPAKFGRTWEPERVMLICTANGAHEPVTVGYAFGSRANAPNDAARWELMPEISTGGEDRPLTVEGRPMPEGLHRRLLDTYADTELTPEEKALGRRFPFALRFRCSHVFPNGERCRLDVRITEPYSGGPLDALVAALPPLYESQGVRIWEAPVRIIEQQNRRP